MRIIFIFFVVTLFLISFADCKQQYNPMENEWSCQPADAKVEYNPMENKWDWDSGHNPGKD